MFSSITTNLYVYSPHVCPLYSPPLTISIQQPERKKSGFIEDAPSVIPARLLALQSQFKWMKLTLVASDCDSRSPIGPFMERIADLTKPGEPVDIAQDEAPQMEWPYKVR